VTDNDRTGPMWQFESGLRVLMLTTNEESSGFGWNHLVVVLDAGRDENRQGSVGKTLYISESNRRRWGSWPSTERLVQDCPRRVKR